MKPAIEIRNIGKEYKLATSQRYVALRDVLAGSFKKVLAPGKKKDEKFWALKDINLDIMPGERVGIIGRNGAGKSTLLKIISRITPPTTGEAIIRGRVGSLLEVGTGFHPELTGRENIYLNGSILGLKKSEIDTQLDAIIDFSGVEKFIDSPLKHFSSGMQLRLAFAVAAHLEPEILLIDEVLAVGDMEFQKKCIGKMEEVSKNHGRTIVFVSHNIAVLKQLCTKGVLLQQGQIEKIGLIGKVVNAYSQTFLSSVIRREYGVFDLTYHPNKVQKTEGLFSAAISVDNVLTEVFVPGKTLRIDISYYLETDLIDPEIGIVIRDENYHSLIGLNNKHLGLKLSLKKGKQANATILLPELNIYKPGKYTVNLYMGDQFHFYECLYDAFEFTINPHDVFSSGTNMLPEWNTIYVPKMKILS